MCVLATEGRGPAAAHVINDRKETRRKLTPTLNEAIRVIVVSVRTKGAGGEKLLMNGGRLVLVQLFWSYQRSPDLGGREGCLVHGADGELCTSARSHMLTW